MVDWKRLETEEQIEELIAQSRQTPCLLFKHSTRCSISFIAQHRLEKDWQAVTGEIIPWYLDLIRFRPLSNLVAEHFGVRHESPQVLLIQQGRCIFHASHLDISVDELSKRLQQQVG